MKLFRMSVVFFVLIIPLLSSDFKWGNAVSPEILLKDPFVNPVFSTIGNDLLLQKPGFGGLYIYNFKKKSLNEIRSPKDEIVQASWGPNAKYLLLRSKSTQGIITQHHIELLSIATKKSEILYKENNIHALPQFTSAMDHIYFPIDNEMKIITSSLTALKTDTKNDIISIQNDHFTIQSSDGKYLIEKETEENKRIIRAEFSKSRKAVLLKSAGGNIKIYNITTDLFIDIGPGNAPKWGFNDEYVIFCRVEDDGHDYTHSELWIYDIFKKSLIQLTHTPDKIELDPTWSANGQYIVFNDYRSNEIYLIDLFK